MKDERWRDCEGTWDRLRWSRIRAGFEKANAAAESLGMKDDTYTAYERRPDSSKHTALDHQRAGQFAKKFKVSWRWLLLGEGEPGEIELTAAQKRAVAAMREAPEDEQERAADVIETMLRRALGG
jgi:hypothetical protein